MLLRENAYISGNQKKKKYWIWEIEGEVANLETIKYVVLEGVESKITHWSE